MKRPYLYVQMLVVLTALFVGTAASAATIEVIETFDYPGTGNLTLPQKINDRGVIVGIVVDVNGVSSGFYRSRNGRFSDAFVEPNDTGNLTNGRGINNARTICGEYLNGSDGTFHGYFLSHQVFTQFDVPGTLDTILLGINNAGDFVGSVIESDGVTQDAFLSLGGAITTFAIPGAAASLAYSLNASDQALGYYLDPDLVTTHGYLRDSDGTLDFPIDPAGSVGTVLFGNNDSNWVVGRYADAAGVTHGLFFMTAGDYLTFDYPGSAFTSLNGINQQGFICGRYVDAAGIAHGFLAKVNPNGTDSGNHLNRNVPLTPVRPPHPTPETLGIHAPAS